MAVSQCGDKLPSEPATARRSTDFSSVSLTCWLLSGALRRSHVWLQKSTGSLMLSSYSTSSPSFFSTSCLRISVNDSSRIVLTRTT